MPRALSKTEIKAPDGARVLPEVAHTRSGIAFRPSDDLWRWRDGPFEVNLSFERVDSSAALLLPCLKHTLCVFAKQASPSHLGNLYEAFVHFLRRRVSNSPLTSITTEEISNYIATLKQDEKWRIGHLNVLLQKWAALELPGVDEECVRYLSEIRKPGNVKGAAVRQRDPFNGPFSEEEYTALYKAVDAAYGTGEIPPWVIVLARLLFATGARISQMASLKVKDLRIERGKYVLNLPHGKTGLVNNRESFIEFVLSPQTGRLVMEHIERMNADSDAPLFPEHEVHVRTQHPRPTNDPFAGHCISQVLSAAFSRAIGPITPLTSRLNFQTFTVLPKRFRSTFATRMAEEGASRAVIAERLGHTDLQNVDVYFEASPAIVDSIDRAMSRQLAPLARAFRGRLVEDEAHSTHKGAPGSRIIDFRVSTKPLASCAGKAQGCAFNKPVACYTCHRFEPWLDAPHEKVLQRLKAERTKWQHDERLAAINDDAIEAVREVIAECARARKQQGAREQP
ncbi:MAG: site-specific integrase [Curvibacter sp.]|nr:site-specific integrase [Curvibacter sp.]